MVSLGIFKKSIACKLIFAVGLTVLTMVFIGALIIIDYEKKRALDAATAEADRLSNTILLGTHYAMMLNSRNDINQIIRDIASLEEIENIRVYNKEGVIHFSNIQEEVSTITNIRDEACFVCHREAPPLETLALDERKRIFKGSGGDRFLGIISPIYNESGCAESCHFHPKNKKVLGALDVVIPLKQTDQWIAFYEKSLSFFALCMFLICSSVIAIFVMRFVNRPIKKLIRVTRQISEKADGRVEGTPHGEIKQLAQAINQMAQQMALKQRILNEQRQEYQNLFEAVPCLITVQNRNFELLQYNREFEERFHPQKGDLCYQAYKNRSRPCKNCPMVETFKDGQSHHSEQSGMIRPGKTSYWTLRTAPIKDADGNVSAVMEISVDITRMRLLENEVRRSEEKYRAIFDNTPNPLFVLERETLKILDCNASAHQIYGYSKKEMFSLKFGDFFDPEFIPRGTEAIRACKTISKVRHIGKKGKIIFVDISVAPSQYQASRVLLVNATDVTEQLTAEQQLIQTSKMATLGEMATGIAHELNQPLTVIKTAAGFFLRKTKRKEPIDDDIMSTMAEKIDGQVDRASKIINHMREFGRKSDAVKEKADINRALINAFDIFRQQLKLHQIDVIRRLDTELPPVMADENRLEQVFINILINARDAIDSKSTSTQADATELKQIYLTTKKSGGGVIVEIEDTGTGIPEAIADKIFDPFFTTKQAGKGTGLGLSISYGIIKGYNGHISAQKGKFNGALFIIKLPCA